jgi:signal transduction histidine kinase
VRGSIVDITQRRRTEAELQRYRDGLEQRVQERTAELIAAQQELVRKERLATIGQLTGTVSHELRNPLATIANSFATLRAQLGETQPAQRRTLARIDRSIARCVRIIDELLDYARVQEPEFREIEVDPWLDSMLGEIEVPRGVEFERALHSGARVRLDPDRLRQAIVDLVQNAFQALLERDDGGKVNRVSIATACEGEFLELCVQDSGPGVPLAVRERIFEPLFSTRSFGVGLGLPLVVRVAEQHRGTLTLDASPQGGARFTLRLPLRSPDPG